MFEHGFDEKGAPIILSETRKTEALGTKRWFILKSRLAPGSLYPVRNRGFKKNTPAFNILKDIDDTGVGRYHTEAA